MVTDDPRSRKKYVNVSHVKVKTRRDYDHIYSEYYIHLHTLPLTLLFEGDVSSASVMLVRLIHPAPKKKKST